MPDPAKLRDSTQIVVPCESLDALQAELERKFAVTVFEQCPEYRIIGSPVVIKEVSDFLARHGVTLQ